jgi:hypothetical protein
MTPKRQNRQRQQTTKAVLDALLGFVQRKWYEGDPVNFAKDNRRLLQWVLLWPARHFFTPKGVTVPADRYRDLMMKVLMDATVFQTGPIKYRPAWLMQVVQSHFKVHGDDIYDEAKSIRTLAEHALLTLGKVDRSGQDALVPEFVAASRLLDRKKPVSKRTNKDQLSLL